MDTRGKIGSPADENPVRLFGVVSRILDFPDGSWAEIAVDGAPDLFREIRVPYPLQNEDGTVNALKLGDRVSINVTAEAKG